VIGDPDPSSFRSGRYGTLPGPGYAPQIQPHVGIDGRLVRQSERGLASNAALLEHRAELGDGIDIRRQGDLQGVPQLHAGRGHVQPRRTGRDGQRNLDM
jgi:hypothetical protein